MSNLTLQNLVDIASWFNIKFYSDAKFQKCLLHPLQEMYSKEMWPSPLLTIIKTVKSNYFLQRTGWNSTVRMIEEHGELMVRLLYLNLHDQRSSSILCKQAQLADPILENTDEPKPTAYNPHYITCVESELSVVLFVHMHHSVLLRLKAWSWWHTSKWLILSIFYGQL